jgi:hypothetical protein
MTWNDHDHRGQYADDRHDHYREYAEYNHGHRDLDSVIAGLREDLRHAEERIRELEGDRAGVLAQLRVLDRLRPTCVVCHDAAADRQTARGSACSDCVGDLPDDGPDPDRPETWAFGEVNEDQADEPGHGPAAMRRFMLEHRLGAPRQASRVYGPDARCEFVDHGMCGAPAVARVTSRAGPSEHLWCCGPHRDHMLRVSPDDAYVSWAKPDEPAPATLTCLHCGAEATGRPGDRCPECSREMQLASGDEPEEETPAEPYNPGPEIDDEGGMSEYRYILPEDYQRGQS